MENDQFFKFLFSGSRKALATFCEPFVLQKVDFQKNNCIIELLIQYSYVEGSVVTLDCITLAYNVRITFHLYAKFSQFHIARKRSDPKGS